MEAPALWLARTVPAVVVLAPAPPGAAGIASHTLLAWPDIRADLSFSDGRHLVLGDRDGLHRAWLRPGDPQQSLAVTVIGDGLAGQRFAAAWRLFQRFGLTTGAGGRGDSGASLSTFQRSRLMMLLGILDDIQTSGMPRMSLHDIASRHVYRGMTLERGAVWKGSSERRRTQRLVREALDLMQGGYRDLLVG